MSRSLLMIGLLLAIGCDSDSGDGGRPPQRDDTQDTATRSDQTQTQPGSHLDEVDRLVYYRSFGPSRGAGFSHLLAVEVCPLRQRLRSASCRTRFPAELPKEREDIEVLLAGQHWRQMSPDEARLLSDRLHAWLATEPPSIYNNARVLGCEDGYAEALVVQGGEVERVVAINPKGGNSPNDPLEPPPAWRELLLVMEAIATKAGTETQPAMLWPGMGLKARIVVLHVRVSPFSGTGRLSQVRGEVLEVLEGDLAVGRQVTFTLATDTAEQFAPGEQAIVTKAGPGRSVADDRIQLHRVDITTGPAAQPGTERDEIVFGKARIALGMTRQQVLDQIRLSREQYDPLYENTGGSIEMYGVQPSDEMTALDLWSVRFVSRNSRTLGGSGIELQMEFRDGQLTKITTLPWLAG